MFHTLKSVFCYFKQLFELIKYLSIYYYYSYYYYELVINNKLDLGYVQNSLCTSFDDINISFNI